MSNIQVQTSAPRINAPHSAHGAAHGQDHGHGHGDEEYHGTFKGYMTGFVLAVILTAIPFWLVMGKVFQSSTVTAAILLALAAVQIVVHMVYFLHLDTKSQGGWNVMALMFALILVVITLSGSIWVMYHMNTNMMPMPSAQEMRNMP